MSTYQSLTSYYDAIFPLSEARIQFLLRNLSVSPACILDVGCATGTLSINLAMQGHKVIGIDNDRSMIAHANSKIQNDNLIANQVLFYANDMENISEDFTKNSFDMVVCLGNTLAHLLGHNIIKTFLMGTRKILKPGGKCLIQIVNYDHILAQKKSKLPVIENNLIRFERYYLFSEEIQNIEFLTVLTVKEKRAKFTDSTLLYPLKKMELENLLSNSGFNSMEWYSTFEGKPYHPNSLGLIVVVQ